MGKIKDITGQKFGMLTALKKITIKGKNARWLFRCDCGIEKEIGRNNVVSGSTVSCGCYGAKQREIHSFGRADLLGKRFHKLTVIKYLRSKSRTSLWLCECDCGNTTEVLTHNLIAETTKSCGCLHFRKGKDHPSFKSGKTVDRKGYVKVLTFRDNKSVYVCEHRLIMEKIIGRRLLDTENVHHINGIKNDNRPENLELWARTQPSGQRIKDLVNHAREILNIYAHLC